MSGPVTPRTFRLVRTEDVSGVSGTGAVAEGVTFTDGTTVLRWLRAGGSTAVYDSHERMAAIHGHDGRTTVEWAEARAAAVAPLEKALRDLLWWHEWMQREDCFTADLADTDEESDRRSTLWNTFPGGHVEMADWLRALLAATPSVREPDPWHEALADPRTKAALDEGLADVAAGRVTPYDPSPVREPEGLDVERRAIVAAARRFLAAHDSMIGSGGVTRDDAFVTKNRADELRAVIRLYDENADRLAPERPADEVDGLSELRVARLTLISVACIPTGLIYAVLGVAFGTPALGVGLGLAIAALIIMITCLIVAEREGWTP